MAGEDDCHETARALNFDHVKRERPLLARHMPLDRRKRRLVIGRARRRRDAHLDDHPCRFSASGTPGAKLTRAAERS
jgi:hypothetical protein